MYGQLFQAHSVLITTFAESKKRCCPEDPTPGLDKSNNPSAQVPATARQSVNLSRSDYPEVKYWTRQEWKIAENRRKDLSEVPTGGGSRGGARSAMGENVMMLYIEEVDGQPVDGTIAAQIREFARSIWRGFYKQKMAPDTWGEVDDKVQDYFVCEMEERWTVLRYCDNHWKANAIATSLYSQWYHTYDRKKKGLNEPAAKRPRIATEEPGDAHSPTAGSQADRVPSPTPETPVDDITEAPSSRLDQQGVTQASSRPRARPLRNPL